MAYYIDPETGERVYYDEQEDALTEQMIMDEPPLDARPFMPPPNRYEARPVGPPEGRRTSRGEIAQALLDMERERKQIPQRPTLLNDVSYEDQPGVPPRGSVESTLLTNMAQYRERPNTLFADEYAGELIRYGEAGEEVGERGIIEKRKPPGPKPTLDKLDRMEFTNLHMKEKDPELREKSEEFTKEWENGIPYTTRALKPDAFAIKRAEKKQTIYNELRKEELQLVGTFITDHQRDQATARAVEERKTAAALAAQKEKVGQNWILSDRSIVISYDGGQSFATGDGQRKPMPATAIKMPGGATIGEVNLNQAKKEAIAEMGGEQADTASPKALAVEGTGPYSRLASLFEAVAGGLGADILFGQKGFFPEMADAKQYLRTVKQIGKAALMNSSRGAIWEQEKIDALFPDPDKTFTNPRIESRKFGNLISTLEKEKKFNNQAIVGAMTPKELEKYRTSNNEIDRLIALIKEPPAGKISKSDTDLINKYRKRKP